MGVRQGLSAVVLALNNTGAFAVAQHGAPYVAEEGTNLVPTSDTAIDERYASGRDNWGEGLSNFSRDTINRIEDGLNIRSSADLRTANRALGEKASYVAGVNDAQQNIETLAGPIIESTAPASGIDPNNIGDEVYIDLLNDGYRQNRAAIDRQLLAEHQAEIQAGISVSDIRAKVAEAASHPDAVEAGYHYLQKRGDNAEWVDYDLNNERDLAEVRRRLGARMPGYNETPPFDAEDLLEENRAAIVAGFADEIAEMSASPEPTLPPTTVGYLSRAIDDLGSAGAQQYLADQLTDTFGAEQANALAAQAMDGLPARYQNVPAPQTNFSDGIISADLANIVNEYDGTGDPADARARLDAVRTQDEAALAEIDSLAATAQPAGQDFVSSNDGRPDYASPEAEQQRLEDTCERVGDDSRIPDEAKQQTLNNLGCTP